MKRIIASAGLVALGAASSQGLAQGLAPAEQAKPWNVSLAVRGFYDDNYTTQSDSLKRDSYGVSVNPTLGINFNLEQTVIAFNYSYDLRWYEDRESNEADHIQVASLSIDHNFTDRFSASLSDRFVYAQEGSVYFGTGPVTTLQSDGDYVRNLGDIGVKAGLTERLGLSIGYSNDFLDYDQENKPAADGGPVYGSYSALLDRMEHAGTLEAMFAVSPKSQLLVGYQYRTVLHSSDDAINAFGDTGDARDANSHYIYAGLEHTFSPKLSAAIRAGGQFIDYVNAEDTVAFAGEDDSSILPYVNASLTYTYNPGSTLVLGVINTYNQTDVSSALDQQSVNVYLKLNHRITPKWSVGALGMFQHSSFNGGVYDGETEMFYMANVNTTYQLAQSLSAEAGYNYDQVDSDLGGNRSFDRNRVYVGLRAAF